MVVEGVLRGVFQSQSILRVCITILKCTIG